MSNSLSICACSTCYIYLHTETWLYTSTFSVGICVYRRMCVFVCVNIRSVSNSSFKIVYQFEVDEVDAAA